MFLSPRAWDPHRLLQAFGCFWLIVWSRPVNSSAFKENLDWPICTRGGSLQNCRSVHPPGHYATGSCVTPDHSTPCLIQADWDVSCGDDRRENNNAPPLRREWAYVVRFDGRDGEHEVLLRAGDCWGTHPVTGEDYNCLGRCGQGCGDGILCSNWSKKCLRHDVCSWYYGATQGAADADCGDEFIMASSDWASYCGWGWGWTGDRCELFDHRHQNLQSSIGCGLS